ncbi:uncharacterized protein [Musca autumnalis]|uniref:uncharacterized protein n=1 Tax=Musca autumnalis TaxID=221902 RepID=UPI003CF70260
MSASTSFVIEKLLGRENYTTWAFAVKTLLQHEDLWDTVQGVYPSGAIDQKVDTKAKTKIVLLVDKVNYVHIEDAETSKEVWDKLKSAFQDSGLTRRVGLLRQLITTSFAACGSVEEYVSQIVSTAHKLKEVDMPVSDEWVGTLLLAGLPEEYAPMIMGIESSGVKITGDSIKTKLLQDVKKRNESSDAAFLAAKKKFYKKRMRCFNCNRIGHIAADCQKKKHVDKKESGFCTVFVAKATNDRDWFIDSGASLHMSMRKEWFTGIRPSTVKEIFVANKEKLGVEGIGDTKFKLFVNGKNMDITFYDVLYVPNLSVNLLSVSQIISRGYTVQFRNNKCEVKRGGKVIASATRENNMFRLDGNTKQMCMAVTTYDVDIWHSRMGHLTYVDMKKTQEQVNAVNSDGTINVDSDGTGVDDGTVNGVNVDPVRNDDASDGTITDRNGTSEDGDSSDGDDSLDFFEPDETLTSEDTNVVVNEENVDGTVRRSARTPKPVKRSEYYLYAVEAGGFEDPFTLEEAFKDMDAKQWRQAMKSEYQSLMQNNTWTLVNLPPGVKPIKCKWVIKRKRDERGNVIKHKARLVIKGCSQKQGIDFQETYSPVVRYASMRYLLSIAAQFNLDIEQMDAVTAFLQGELDEEIFMEPPEGIEGDFVGKVCRLNKAIYGLKQASRQWNKKLDAALKSLNLRQSNMDPCIYYNISGPKIFFIAVYVDDILIFSNNDAFKDKVKSELQRSFSMKDLGAAKNCVGLHITRNRDKGEIYVDQTIHVNEFLRRFNMAECKPISTPFDINVKLKKPDFKSSISGNIPYQEAIGCLLYLVQGTRPDLAYAINYLSKFNDCFDNTHWSAVKRVFRYLKGTKNAALVFKKNDNGLQIRGFCDADYAGDVSDRRSCTGYVFMQQGPISWNSKRQATVALSTTEADYMAMSAAVQEAEWLRQFQKEFFGRVCRDTILLQCDNRSAINLANTEAYHARTKHIDVRHHFVRDKIDEGHIELQYESSENMVADFLTKPLSKEKHMSCDSSHCMEYVDALRDYQWPSDLLVPQLALPGSVDFG